MRSKNYPWFWWDVNRERRLRLHDKLGPTGFFSSVWIDEFLERAFRENA
jgi:hypothetical protein